MQNRFQQIFEAKGLTLGKFASIINTSQSSISHIMGGRNQPSSVILTRIAETFPEINIGWLLTGNGGMYMTSFDSSSPREQEPILHFESERGEKELNTANQVKGETSSLATPASPQMPPVAFMPPDPAIPSKSSKKVKRIVLFFNDGSFEDYQND